MPGRPPPVRTRGAGGASALQLACDSRGGTMCQRAACSRASAGTLSHALQARDALAQQTYFARQLAQRPAPRGAAPVRSCWAQGQQPCRAAVVTRRGGSCCQQLQSHPGAGCQAQSEMSWLPSGWLTRMRRPLRSQHPPRETGRCQIDNSTTESTGGSAGDRRDLAYCQTASNRRNASATKRVCLATNPYQAATKKARMPGTQDGPLPVAAVACPCHPAAHWPARPSRWRDPRHRRRCTCRCQ